MHLPTVLVLSLLFLVQVTYGQSLTPYFNYTILESDKSLWSISQKHQVSVDQIKVLNQKTDDAVKAGDVLKIPSQGTQEDQNVTYHTVKKSDKNLWRISQKYKVSVEDLMKANNKENSIIRNGEKLKIPKNGQYIIHEVSPTDKSLWGIAKIYDIEVADLKKANQKENNLIRVGDLLIIPKEHQQAIVNTNTATDVLPINGDKEGVKAGYDFESNKWRFPYQNRRELHIFPSIKTGFTNYFQLNSVEYAAFFQNSKDYSPNKEQKNRYYYSIETPFAKSLDDTEEEYMSLAEMRMKGVENGFTYDFITLIEADPANNSYKLLPIFLVRDAFGKVQGTVEKGAFACCPDPFPLAVYSKTATKEVISHSKLLRPSIIKYTEVVHHFKNGRTVQTDSTILILQLKTDRVPDEIDSARFKNGKKTKSFSNFRRRNELNY